MNSEQIKGNWNILKGKVKQSWGELTDDEVDKIDGRRDELVGTIQRRYGIEKEEAERQVDEWS